MYEQAPRSPDLVELRDISVKLKTVLGELDFYGLPREYAAPFDLSRLALEYKAVRCNKDKAIVAKLAASLAYRNKSTH